MKKMVVARFCKDLDGPRPFEKKLAVATPVPASLVNGTRGIGHSGSAEGRLYPEVCAQEE
jgi:hypothetical protein